MACAPSGEGQVAQGLGARLKATRRQPASLGPSRAKVADPTALPCLRRLLCGARAESGNRACRCSVLFGVRDPLRLLGVRVAPLPLLDESGNREVGWVVSRWGSFGPAIENEISLSRGR